MVLTNPKTAAVRGERGAVLVLSVLLMTGLLGVTAFVVDLGNARQTARNVQGAADAAALAGSQDLPLAALDPAMALTARNTARTYAASSLGDNAAGPACASQGDTCTFTVGAATVTATTPYALNDSMVPSYNLVRVEICEANPAQFSKVWSADPITVCRESVARRIQDAPGTEIGMMAMNPTTCTVQFNGNTEVVIQGGALLSNSTSNPAICMSGGGCANFTLTAELVAAGGTITDCVDAQNVGSVVEGADSFPDPFAALPDTVCLPLAATACNGATPSVPTAVGVCGLAMSPGYFGSGCSSPNGNNTVNMAPGVYWFNGSFNPRNNNVRCPTCSAAAGGVLMYFYNGSLSHTGNGTVQLLPYQAGQTAGSTYAGLSIYQRRSNLTVMSLGGTAGSGMGSIYALGARITMIGTSDREIDGIVVAGSYEFQGNSTTTVNTSPTGPTTEPELDIGLEL